MQDEDEQRRKRILKIILIGSLVMFVIFGALLLYYSWLEGSNYREISLQIFSIIAAFFALLYVFSRRGFYVPVSYLLITAYFLGVSYMAYHWGVNLPVALLGYALLITMASMLLGSRSGFIIAGIVAIFIITLWHFQFYGIVPIDMSTPPNNSDAFLFAILLWLFVIIAWISNREIEHSLVRARKSEEALQKERDLLEDKVEERTRELHAAELEKIDHLYRFAEFGRLASGSFHDLLNILNVAVLNVELGCDPNAAKQILESTRSVQREMERFKEAFRRQLTLDNTAEHFSLADAIERVIQFLGYQAKCDGVHISFERDMDDDFMYFGSPREFHHIAMNLILNAIESFEGIPVGPAKERCVTIRLRHEVDEIMWQVEDNGSGVPDDLRKKIFEPFFTTKEKQKKGIGIGLAMTRRIVENDFGGTIELTNGKEGGSIFTVRFPKIHHRDEEG
jgi:signal transduction histidine kinase